LINPDGSDKTVLIEENRKNPVFAGPLLWSPDGRWLLLPRRTGKDSDDLLIMDPETKIMVKIESDTDPRSSWKGRH
jgi:hypothetical protein